MKKFLISLLTAAILLTLVPCAYAADYYNQDFETLTENSAAPGLVNTNSTIVSKGGTLGKAVKVGGRWLTELSSPISGEILIEFDFMQETKSGIYAILTPGSAGSSGNGYNTPNFPYELSSDGTNINLIYGVKGGVARKSAALVSNYQAGTTYSFRFVINTDANQKTLQVWVNGTEALTGENKIFSGSDVPHVSRFNAQLTSGQPFYIGKLRITKFISANGLKTKIDAAQTLHNNAVVGIELGNYTQASKDALAAAIQEAQAVYNVQKDNPDEAVLLAAISALETKMKEFEDSKITKSVSSLKSLITDAQNLIASSVFGDQLGQYPVSSKTALEAEIALARTAAEELTLNYNLQQLNAASLRLEEAMIAFNKSVNTALVEVYSEDFEGGVLPSAWQVIYGAPSVVEENGNHALRFYSSGTGCRALAYLNAAELTGIVTLKFSYMPEAVPTAIHQILEISDSPFGTSDYAFVVTSDSSAIKVTTKTGTDTLVSSYQANTWYHFTFEMNIPAGTVKAYVNDTPALNGETRSLGADFKGLERINSYMLAANSGSYLLDNFSVTSDVLEELKSAAQQIIAQLGTLNAVGTDLILPEQFNELVSISWKSSDTDILSDNGAVNRPIGGNETVSLTMTVEKSGYQYQTVLPVTVLQSFVGESIEEPVSSTGLSAGWSGSASVATLDNQTCLKVQSELSKTFASDMIYPDGRLSFQFRQENKGAVPEILSLLSDSDVQFSLTSDGENIKLLHGGAEQTIIADYEACRWYRIGIAFDNRMKKAIVTVDGTPAESFDFWYQSQKNVVNKIRLNQASVSRAASEFYVDDLLLGRTVPAQVVWDVSQQTALRPGANNLLLDYSVDAFDALGNALLSEKLIASAKKADHSAANGIFFENNKIVITPTADTGALTLVAAMPEGGVSGSTVLQLEPQTISTVQIHGVDSISDTGNYQFTAECFTAQGVVIPATSVTWSVSGPAVVLDAATGQITVSGAVSGVLTVSVVADGVTASKTVRINTAGGGSFGGSFVPSGGGGGGGAGAKPITPVQPAPTTERFTDLDSVSWAKDAILAMEKRGVVKGVSDNEFSPHTKVTRAQFATMLVRAFDLYQADATIDFSDVTEDAWCYREIASLKALGIVNGVSEDYFGIDAPVSREDAAVLLYRTLSLKEITLDAVETAEFTDTAEFASYAAQAIDMLAASGVVAGRDDGSFDPKGTTTRAEATTLLYRLLLKTEGGK